MAELRVEQLTKEKLQKLAAQEGNVVYEYDDEHDTGDSYDRNDLPIEELPDLLKLLWVTARDVYASKPDVVVSDAIEKILQVHTQFATVQKWRPNVFRNFTSKNPHPTVLSTTLYQLDLYQRLKRGEVTEKEVQDKTRQMMEVVLDQFGQAPKPFKSSKEPKKTQAPRSRISKSMSMFDGEY